MIDESAFTKKGAQLPAGVARQHNGRLGKQDNCQVGVFLVGVTPAGQALLDHRLFLPESWVRRHVRRGARPAGGGPHPRGRDLPHQAADRGRVDPRRRGARAGRAGLGRGRLGVRPGGAPPRRAGMPRAARCAGGPQDVGVLDVRPGGEYPVLLGTGSQAECPQTGRLAHPGGRDRRRTARFGVDCALEVREGAAGPLVLEFAAIRVWGIRHRKPGPPAWLLIRRVAGTGARAEVLHLPCGSRDAAVDTGPGGLHAVPGGGVPGRQQELPGDDAVRERGRGSVGIIT